MNTKLTLTPDKSVIKDAKIYAEQQGRRLSALVETYLKSIAQSKKNIADFKILFTFLDVVVIDKTVIMALIESEFSDFEDALQNFSAENQGKIKTKVTRNINDYKKSKLNILTPTMFLETL